MASKKKSKSKSKSSKSSTFGESLGNAWNKTKQAASNAKDKFDERMTMQGLLTQARISLEQYLDPKVIPAEERMSRSILRNAKGIALITEAKGGFIVGVKGGSGVIMVKKQSKSKFGLGKKKAKDVSAWSSPCAVGTGGLSVGFLAGATKVDHIIILSTQDQIDMFLSNGQLQLKGNANATAAKWGRNADAGIGVGSNKQTGPGNEKKNAVAPFYTYSFGVKGLYGGVSLDGEVLAVRKDCNEVFYDKTVHVKDILCGAVKMPKKNKDYITICKLLNEYVAGHDDDEKDNDDLGIGSVQPAQRRPPPKGKGKGKGTKGGQKQYQIPQNEYVANNATNQAAMQSIAQNKEVQSAARTAAKDKNVQKAAFNAYKSGGNDPNANKQLAKSLAKNKAVQGAAVSVAKDEKVQKAAWQTAKQNANKKNFGKAKQYMMNSNNSSQSNNYV